MTLMSVSLGTSAVEEAAASVLSNLKQTPALASLSAVDGVVILGSGLKPYPIDPSTSLTIPYSNIPHMPQSSVAGHAGQLVIHSLEGKTLALLQGRFHYYEGYDFDHVLFPLRVLHALGASHLVVTNAAGGIRQDLQPGMIMAISDHLNLMGINPLRGPEAFGPRFIDCSDLYQRPFYSTLQACAQTIPDLTLTQGVYAAVSGPTYETPAEVRMLKTLGADAVGMSTVPEVLAARQMGMKTIGLSCITNKAAGLIEGHVLSHEEVLSAGKSLESTFPAFLKAVLSQFI